MTRPERRTSILYHAAEAAVFVACLVVLGALVMVWGAPL